MKDIQIQFANDFVAYSGPSTLNNYTGYTLDKAMELFIKVEPYVDRIEVGTPLIKLGGMRTITDLASLTKKPIVADMKTLDGGGIEVAMAARAGANVVMVSGHASNATLKSAISAARKYSVELMVELDMELKDVYKRAVDVSSLGADSLEFHVGIDMRTVRKPLSFRNIRLIKKLSKVNTLAVAAGLDRDSAIYMATETDVKILVFGKYLYESMNPDNDAKGLKEALGSL